MQKGLQVIADSALLRKREGVFFIAGTGGKPQSCGRWFVPTIEYRFTICCLSENCVDEYDGCLHQSEVTVKKN